MRTKFSAGDIEHKLDVYDETLRTAGLQRAAVSTYLGHARRYVRWRRPTPASATDLEGELVERVKPALVKLGIGVYFVTFGQKVVVERVLDHVMRSRLGLKSE